MDALKAEINKLMQQRKAVEHEIEERSARLNAPGQPGMTGNLLDKEGFPRSDIDVHAVRTDRNAVIRLTNDHKQLSTQLEQLLHQLHALARSSGAAINSSSQQTTTATAAPAVSTPSPAEAAAEQHHEDKKQKTEAADGPVVTQTAAAAAALRPFAVVDDVAEHSPAAAAGIQLGDQLCKFGTAVAGSGSELQQVAQELQAHENQAVHVVFMRAGQQVEMQLVPRRWEGRGLLGCHLRPL